LLDHRRGRLTPELAREVEAHLAGCAECARAAEAERALDELLEQRLPRRAAPPALKRALAERFGASNPEPRAGRAARLWPALRPVALLAAAAAVALASTASYQRFVVRDREVAAQGRLVNEVVNDHLRVLYSEHPLDVESGGIHRVKPWFQGRLDFAPVVEFAGDDDFPLQGGAVGYLLDRKAAVFVFKRRLHSVTLLVFRGDGLAWPKAALQPMGNAEVRVERDRGFNVVLWRAGELGYALASDLNLPELLELGAKIAR
jgi:anti-sigma factor RsiW